LEILEHRVAIDIDTVKIIPRESGRTLADMVPARWARVHIDRNPDGWRAHKLEKLPRVPGYELEIEAIIEGVHSDARGALWIDLCGMRALVGKDVRWKQFNEAAKPFGDQPLDRRAPAAVVEELYDLRVDPGEQHNIVDSHAELAAEMFGKLSSLHEGLASPGAWNRHTVDLDGRTRERLKSLGYVE